jgi:hypothetical protein
MLSPGPESVEPDVHHTVEFARCFLRLLICPTSRSIVSAAMKQPSGAKSVRSCLLSMLWIVANHKRESAVCVSVAGKTGRPMNAITIELPRQPRMRC